MTRARASFAAALVCALAGTARAEAPLSGQVLDAATRKPLAGAIVRIQATDTKVFTDEHGRFRFDALPVGGTRIVAGAVGYYYAGAEWGPASEVVLALDAVPYDPTQPVPLIAPSECATCHPTQHREWSASAMAHAGRNTWVYDLYDGTGTERGMGGFVYTRDSVHAGSNFASECAACHAPERWIEAPHSAIAPRNALEERDLRGVSCLVCHAASAIDTTRPSFPGIYEGVVRMQRGALVRYGTLGDVDFHAPGRMRASWQPQLSSDLCGACHQDSADPHGQRTYDGVVSEPTYLEWKASAYADPASPLFSSCMDCHSDDMDAPRASVIGGTHERPLGDLRTHTFEGTTPRFLEAAVEVTLGARQLGDQLEVETVVTNTGAGHHVPTGVTMRNMIVLVEARIDDVALPLVDGPQIDPLGGVGDPGAGYYAGLPGRLYAQVNEAADGSGPTLFTDAVRVRYDNRIPALGSDVLVHRFQLPRGAGLAHLHARVVYRRAWRALVDAKGWTEDGHGRPLADLAPPHFGHLMASATATVELTHTKPPRDVGCSQSHLPPATWLVLLLLARAKSRSSRSVKRCS